MIKSRFLQLLPLSAYISLSSTIFSITTSFILLSLLFYGSPPQFCTHLFFTIYPFNHLSILPFSLSFILLFICFIILLFINFTILPFYHFIIYLFYHFTIYRFHHLSTLPFYQGPHKAAHGFIRTGYLREVRIRKFFRICFTQNASASKTSIQTCQVGKERRDMIELDGFDWDWIR